MAKYIERLKDGTVREVKYDPCHDGPVSERLYLERRVQYLSRYCRKHPAHWKKKEELRNASRKLHNFIRAVQAAVVPRKPDSQETRSRNDSVYALRARLTVPARGNGACSCLSNARFNQAEEPPPCNANPHHECLDASCSVSDNRYGTPGGGI